MDIREIEAILRADEEKAAQFKQALESAKDNGSKSDAEAYSIAAAAIGIEITPEQIEQSAAASQAVSDEDLELVTGGSDDFVDENGRELFCMYAWHCFGVILHTETDSHKASCWSDYLCVWASH